jgi:fatty-acyl-CoA synthase
MSVASTGSQRWQDTVRFADLLLRAAERDPDREAVVFPGAGVTYRELEQRAFGVARSLLAAGLGPRSRVGILMPNCIEFVELLFGISLAGGVMVPINARFAPRELAYVIENGDLEMLFTSDVVIEHVDYVERLHEALPQLRELPPAPEIDLPEAPNLRSIVLLGGREAAGMATEREFATFAKEARDEDVLTRHLRTSVRGDALMMYTSGTTAMPKGCVLSHEALVRTAVVAGRTKFRITPEDRFWDPLPMFHMSAILPIIGVFDGGGTFLSMTHFEPDSALRMLDEERATLNFATFPAITQALLNHPEYHPDRWRGIRVINNVAPPDTLRDMQSRMPHTIQISSYGLTECGGVVAFNDPEDTLEQRCTTSGIPFDGIEVEVRDLLTGEPVPPLTRGEIVVRGYCVFDRYHKDPRRTAEAVDDDGWFRTGDIGSMTAEGRISYLGRTKDMLKVGGENVAAIEIESFLATHPCVSIVAVVGVPDEGYLYLTDRKADMIISGGVNIYPQEAENVLVSHPSVADAAVFGIPNAELGEEVKAVVQLVDTIPATADTAQELLTYCYGRLAKYKCPRTIDFSDELPRHATGKLYKRLLRDRYVAAASAVAYDATP